MKLTKQLEAEVLKTYQASWNALFRGDIKTFASLLDDNVVIYGSASGEIFTTKKAAEKFYTATADQITGKVDLRKRKIGLKAVNNTVVVHELCELFFLTEQGWVFYGPARITDILEKKGTTWKIIHHHTSFPDSRTIEGEQFATEKIKAENLLLRDAVQRRTVELEHKNRELEIETALEKVRTVAMAMKKADDMLSVCKTISQQLAQLGVKEIRNVQTAIFYVDRGTYMNYEYYAKHTKTFITEVAYKNHKIQLAFAKKMMKGPNEEVLEHLKGKKLQDWYAYQKTTNQFADNYLLKAHSLNYYWYSLGPVALGISTYYPLTKDETVLFKRFLKVFELAYRRYLDIEKAEAQAREAQIEAALERIRARALAMHQSEEFTEVAKVMREQMGLLGQPELETSAVHLYNEDADHIFSWRAFRLSSQLKGNINYGFFKIPKTSCTIAKEFVQKFKSRATDYTIEVSGAKQTAWYKVLFMLAPEVADAMKKSGTTKEKRYYHFSKFTGGALLMVSSKEPANDAIELQKRSAQVFDLAYRRFKDLQKAEAQAREAQIETSLERIRAASLAMQDSTALSEIIFKVYGELTKLDAKLDRCFIMIVHPENKGITWWMAGHEGLLAENGFFVQMNQHPSHLMYLDYCNKREKKWTYLFEGKEKRDWDRFGFSKTELAKLPEPIKAFMAAAKKVHLSGSSDQFGSLVTGSFEPLPEEQQEIISRFAVAFNQAYIRFLDLQKAEARAREAKIEAALERVRSRSLAMHKSEELNEVVTIFFEKLKELHIQVAAVGISIYIEGSRDWNNYVCGQTESGIVINNYQLPYFDHKITRDLYEVRKNNLELFIGHYSKKEKDSFYKYAIEHSQLKEELADEVKQMIFKSPSYTISAISTKYATIIINDFEGKILSAYETDIIKRFSKVFDQAYTRFLDLQKAEAQAREAQIEVAVERVRTEAMAMHSSRDFGNVSQQLLQQVKGLGIKSFTGATIYFIDENEFITAYDFSSFGNMADAKNQFLRYDANKYPMNGLYPLKEWKKGEAYFELDFDFEKLQVAAREFEEIDSHIASSLKKALAGGHLTHQWEACGRLSGGFIAFDMISPPDDDVRRITLKMAYAFDQAYIRFLDLQKAEAQTRESQIEASLEKVRSRSLAMQKPEELLEVAEVLRNEMGQLGVEELETSSIYLVNKEKEQAECWYAIKDIREEHKKLVSDDITITFNATWVGNEMWKFYKSKKADTSIVMKGENRKEWINYCAGVSNVLQGYYGTEIPERTYHLVKFSGGYMGAASPGEISAESWDLLRRAASVFSLAYTRFHDLQIAEAHARQAELDLVAIKEAKQKAEEALTELQATQKQLIQSEKMASLGELTAGIAHEIQNPLNFVNNFSEVSTELIKEMVEEVDKGNTEEVKAIAEDLVGNLEKIHFHGERAAAIVKGMLQHSRSSSGVKEPTDINALCDEYLRLAYHGLRAKDKSFNARFETSFDASIGNINIMPQEIGRVILNLINNAFYAVNERKKLNEPGYEPTVIVTTQKEDGKKIIAVADNGTGIPKKALDKIFQPFFTTKPTGQGTGLGLSLSYDIITKAHGGELRVETKEGEGTVFTIQLPV